MEERIGLTQTILFSINFNMTFKVIELVMDKYPYDFLRMNYDKNTMKKTALDIAKSKGKKKYLIFWWRR